MNGRVHDIVLSPKAEADLVGVARYTLDRWGNDQAAGYLTELDATIRSLSQNPERGQRRDRLKPGLRSLTHRGHYHIFYRVVDRTVQIVRVLHVRRETKTELDGQ